MNNLKIGIIVLLTLAVLTAGAYFPKIVSTVQDLNNRGEASSSPITSVQLEITKDISSLGRLVMLSRTEGFIELTENQTKMTKEDVMAAVRKGLQPYIDSQLIEYSENEVTLSASLLQVPDILELQSVVWTVHIAGDPACFSSLDLIVDDETGHILQIWYSHDDGVTSMPSYDALILLADIFFSSLEIGYTNQSINADMEYAYDDLSAAERYSFNDPKYGDVFVDFYFSPNGFCIECSYF